MLTGLDFHHVGVLTRKVPLLGWDAVGEIPDFQCVCYLRGQVEFVIPYGGKLLAALEESGDRLHHIALQTTDLVTEVDRLKRAGRKMLLPVPVKGIGGMLVNFILPEQTGILIEVVQCLPHLG